MAKGPRAALTNHPTAQEAADECLQAGGTALDAVLSAYFAVAGATSWGLLAPVTILVAGSGSGVRAVDGRARQPGQGIERPIRYNDDASAPLIARASAPATAAAISVAASMFGRETLAKLAPLGARIARKQGARQRASLITRFGSTKAWLLQDRAFLAEIAERVPRFEGALLQPVDLAIEATDVVACESSATLVGTPAALPPWHDPAAAVAVPAPTPSTGGSTVALLEQGVDLEAAPGGLVPQQEIHRFLALATERGSLAALMLQRPARSIPLFGGEIDLPALGQPVLKAVPRLRPGAPLPLATPLAVLFDGLRATHIAASLSANFEEDELKAAVDPGAAVGLTHRVGHTLVARMPG